MAVDNKLIKGKNFDRISTLYPLIYILCQECRIVVLASSTLILIIPTDICGNMPTSPGVIIL